MLRFGLIVKYLPQPMLRGFTTAAGFHVFTSQIKHVFGIYIVNKENHKVFKLFYVRSCH
jgi:MFS superfamily sulfate permease-like transporter